MYTGPGHFNEPKNSIQTDSIGLGIYGIRVQLNPAHPNPTWFGLDNGFYTYNPMGLRLVPYTYFLIFVNKKTLFQLPGFIYSHLFSFQLSQGCLLTFPIPLVFDPPAIPCPTPPHLSQRCRLHLCSTLTYLSVATFISDLHSSQYYRVHLCSLGVEMK